MSDEISMTFSASIAAWAAQGHQGPLREEAAALSLAYAQGENSSRIDLAAYLTVRAPATFAAISAVLGHVVQAAPEFAPHSMVDVGAGPGTASFAAAECFNSLRHVRMIEADQRFAALARNLASFLPCAADVQHQPLSSPIEKSDLLIAAYVLAEMPLAMIADSVLHLWRACAGVLVVVEPGTPQGFARISAARAALLKAKAHIIGPCTHDEACPMQGSDWCHFKTRLARSRQHMHVKSATVPFEDESYSWLAVARFFVPRAQARIMAPPKAGKAGVGLRLCSTSGLHDQMIAARDKAAYKRARKLKWGEAFSFEGLGVR